jgi:hypothetical protein
MERLDDMAGFAWIDASVTGVADGDDPRAHVVSERLPPQFARYVKLLHDDVLECVEARPETRIDSRAHLERL